LIQLASRGRGFHGTIMTNFCWDTTLH
jgi:hypothetical protein